VQTEHLASLETDDESLKALQVRRKWPRLDTERPVAREAEHILLLCVPRDAVGVGVLVHDFLRDEIVHGNARALVHDGELLAACAQVKAPDRGCVLDELYGELCVDENL